MNRIRQFFVQNYWTLFTGN